MGELIVTLASLGPFILLALLLPWMLWKRQSEKARAKKKAKRKFYLDHHPCYEELH